MAHELRDYQAVNQAQIRQAFSRTKSVMYQAGTGSGKTVVASSIIKKASEKGSPVWFVAHRRELIEQASQELYENGVPNGIIMAGYRYQAHMQVQVASIDTLRERHLKNDKLIITKPPKLLVVDEAHRSLGNTYLSLFDAHPDAWRLGLSATPMRSDGRGLGHAYGAMVNAPTVAELIEDGWLVQPRYFTGATADMAGVNTQNHDYAAGEREARMNNAQLRGDVVEQWLRHGEGRKTIVFAAGVKHSLALREEFEAAGVSAIHIDGGTINSERRDLIDEFRSSDKHTVLCNCMVVTEGFDVPEVGCVSIACPTKMISKYIQMGGRCLRPNRATNKKDCIIIDHGDNVMRHGFLEDPIPWTLDTNGSITENMAKIREELPRQFECHECGCTFMGQIRCPECGTRLEIQPHHELLSTTEELIEVTRGAMGVKASDKQKVYTTAQKENFYAQIKAYANGNNPRGKQYKSGWLMHTYRAKFGVPPHGGMEFIEEMEPTPQVTAFIRAKNAAFQIRRKYREANG
jgi:DNA repair protein RadD